MKGGDDVDEPIELAEYDPSWPARFAAEAARVRAALGDVVRAIEPFGSTAVPGLVGKPVVDLLVGVTDLAAARARLPALVALGYEDFGEIFVPGRIYLRYRGDGPHFNCAVTEPGSAFWDATLAVRDYLRAHPDEAAAYAAEKRAAVARGATLFSTYSREKGPFLEGLRARALAWRGLAP